ncbi:hypothetical protein ACFO9Q_20415 [Paenibacillus sp. GCM10023252]|uniref:COG1470 family protein n=1 Tax=Paenibacillus sp. GCM10023252 TaxID=3252649 RepID=UPI00360DA2E2
MKKSLLITAIIAMMTAGLWMKSAAFTEAAVENGLQYAIVPGSTALIAIDDQLEPMTGAANAELTLTLPVTNNQNKAAEVTVDPLNQNGEVFSAESAPLRLQPGESGELHVLLQSAEGMNAGLYQVELPVAVSYLDGSAVVPVTVEIMIEDEADLKEEQLSEEQLDEPSTAQAAEQSAPVQQSQEEWKVEWPAIVSSEGAGSVNE